MDASGSAYVVGQTISSDLPVINAYQASIGGDYDAFFAKLSPTGNSLISLSYLGGAGSDTATAVALDPTGNVYIAGWTLSANFPVLNGYQSINAGNYGAFVAKLSLGAPPAAVGVTPNSGTGTSQTFAFQFSDTAGASDLTTVSVLFNSSLTTSNACSITYTQAANALTLLTDAGAAPGTSITPGQRQPAKYPVCSQWRGIERIAGRECLDIEPVYQLPASVVQRKQDDLPASDQPHLVSAAGSRGVLLDCTGRTADDCFGNAEFG